DGLDRTLQRRDGDRAGARGPVRRQVRAQQVDDVELVLVERGRRRGRRRRPDGRARLPDLDDPLDHRLLPRRPRTDDLRQQVRDAVGHLAGRRQRAAGRGGRCDQGAQVGQRLGGRGGVGRGRPTSEQVTRDDLVEVVRGDADRKSTRLNYSHVKISYAVFFLI